MKHKKYKISEQRMLKRRKEMMLITDWLSDESEMIKQIEQSLAFFEAKEYRRYVNDMFPMTEGYLKSIPVEKVAKKAGLSPLRVIELVKKHQRKLKFKRIKCPSSSRYGWCLRHEDYEYGASLVDPEFVSLAKELWYIKWKLRACMESPVILVFEERVHIVKSIRCGLTESDILKMITRAAIIGEKLGLDEEKLREWLGLGEKRTTFYLDNGKTFVLDKNIQTE